MFQDGWTETLKNKSIQLNYPWIFSFIELQVIWAQNFDFQKKKSTSFLKSLTTAQNVS